MVSDRRTSGTYVGTEGSGGKVHARIRERLGDMVHVNVTSCNRNVLLTGEAPSRDHARPARRIVANVEHVRRREQGRDRPQVNLTRARQRRSSPQRQARFDGCRNRLYHNIKVVTGANVVFLLGIVTRAGRRRRRITAHQGVQRWCACSVHQRRGKEARRRQLTSRTALSDGGLRPARGVPVPQRADRHRAASGAARHPVRHCITSVVAARASGDHGAREPSSAVDTCAPTGEQRQRSSPHQSIPCGKNTASAAARLAGS